MDFQADFLGLDNVYSYANKDQSTSSRRRTSTMSSTSTSSTYTSRTSSLRTPPYVSDARNHSISSSRPSSSSTSAPRKSSLHRRQQSVDLSLDVDRGAVSAFGELNAQRRKSKSPPRTIIEEEHEQGSKSSTSAPIPIPARQVITASRRVQRDLSARVVDMKRAMDMAGFGAHMNS